LQNFYNLYIYIYINNTKYNIYIYIYNIIFNGLGWSDPTDWAGLNPKLLGRFRPKLGWADLGPKQKTNIFFWARPGPEDRAGPGSAWPKPKRGGGNYFPPTPACRTLLVLHAGKEKEMNARTRGKKSYLARRRLCVAGGAAAEAGGGGVAHGRRLQAALQLFRTSVSFFFLLYFGLLFFFPSLSSLSLFFFPLFFLCFFSPLGFSLLSVLPLSLLCFFCFSPSSLPSLLFPRLSSPIAAVLAVIYRAK